MKFEIELTKNETKKITIITDNGPHFALKSALAANPGYTADGVGEITDDPDEPGAEVESDYHFVEYYCQMCRTPIFNGDICYIFGGEDTFATCEQCGKPPGGHRFTA